MVVRELFERPAHLGERGACAGDAEGDVPQARGVLGLLAAEAVAGGDAGEGALLARCAVRAPGAAGARAGGAACARAASGGGTTAGRRRPRAYSAHVGLLHAHGSARWSAGLCP